jgi:PAS domain S-box-containing protein
MVTNTAACFVLTGVSLWLLGEKHNQSFAMARRLTAWVSAAVVALLGLISLAEHLLTLDLGVDQLLLAAPPALQTATARPGLMSPITAAAFLLLGLALLGIDSGQWQGIWPAQLFSITAGAAAMFGLVTFAFDPHIYAAHLSLALPTGVILATSSLGLICARTDRGLGALLCSQGLGGGLARRLLPAAFIPVVVGWFRWQITAAGLFSEWRTVVLSSLITLFLLGGVIVWVAVIVDRSEAEQVKVEEARERLAAVVECSDDAIISKTLNGIVTAWNHGSEKVFGYSASEAVGKSLWMIIPEERSTEETDILKRIGRGESVKHFDTVRVRKDGTLIDVSVTISPIRDSLGAIVGASKVARDISERKRAEEALREKGRLLSESQRIAHVGSWSFDLNDPSGRIVWSEELYRIYGVSSQTFIPTVESLVSLMVPEDRGVMQKWIAACAAGEQPGEFEFGAALPDGSIRFISARGELQLDANRRPARMVGSAQDITERKQAETALRESEERFHAMLNGIPQLAWMANPEGDIFWFNQRWYDYTGTTFEKMRGWGWQSVHDPETLPKIVEGWKASIANGTDFEMEFPLRAADGHFGTFLTRVVPLKDDQGDVVRWFGTNTDISERKQAAEKLAMQAAELARSRVAAESQSVMFKLVLDNMGEGLIAADQDGHFLIWNDAAHNLMGRGAEDLPTEQWTPHYEVFLPDGITPCPQDRLPLVRALHGESVQVELIVQPPGTAPGKFLEVAARPLKDAQGSLRGGVAVLRDITQRKADEREIQKLNDSLEIRVSERTSELAAANRELESFSYSVSHDLRAPLRHISGFSKMLVEEFGAGLDPGARRYLDRIQAGTQKMGLLVDELLNLAKVGRHAVNRRPAALNAIVAEVIAMLEADGEGRQVEWRVADLPVVDCDPILVKQIFQNLLANALKFTRSRTPAVIEVRCMEPEKDGQAVFMVRDNGIGFSMKYADKLFGVFQRLHRSEDFEGTGIGLATVQRIVQKHGGRVWAEAEVEKGATFYFTLGLGNAAESKSNEAMKSNEATAGGQS